MSLGLRPRPSLSELGTVGGQRHDYDVSLGLRPRPSLSVHRALPFEQPDQVSLGLRPRPSLSVVEPGCGPGAVSSVAGATAPAFVERPRRMWREPWSVLCRWGYGPGLR